MLSTWLRRLGAAVPSRCGVCGAWPAEPVCAGCRARFTDVAHRCTCCALPVPAGVPRCGACTREPPPLDRCHAAVAYAFPWSGVITRFKFQAQPGLAGTLARLLVADPGAQAILGDADLLLPIPLSARRLADRGFNQALELARELAPGKVRTDLLLRLRDTAPQASLTRRQRQANVRSAFGVEPLRAAEVRGRRIALVDDVMTSGASLFAAATALRAAGCSGVDALVVARTDEPG